MNDITRDELDYIEQTKNYLINNYNEFVRSTIESNKEVENYLKEHDGQIFKVDRTTYSTDKKMAKGKIQKEHLRPSEMIAKRNKLRNEVKEEMKGEFLSFDIPTWTSKQFIAIHRNESKVDELDPKNPRLDDEDFKINHKSMLNKIALFAASREINRKRSILSHLFNWKRNIQNWWAARKVRKSIELENGLKKKDFKTVYKFIKNQDPNKYNNLVGINEKKIYSNEAIDEKRNIEFSKDLFELNTDKLNEKDRILNKVNSLNKETEIEQDEPFIF